MCKDCFNHFCIQRWINRKVKYINLLGGKCERCGLTLNNSHYSVFEFHHVDPSTKEYVWTKLRLFSDDRIKNELDKCQLLCANCHRIVHSEKEHLYSLYSHTDYYCQTFIKQESIAL